MSDQYFHESSNVVLPRQGEETPLSAVKEVTEVESAPVQLPHEVGMVALGNRERGVTAVDHTTRIKGAAGIALEIINIAEVRIMSSLLPVFTYTRPTCRF